MANQVTGGEDVDLAQRIEILGSVQEEAKVGSVNLVDALAYMAASETNPALRQHLMRVLVVSVGPDGLSRIRHSSILNEQEQQLIENLGTEYSVALQREFSQRHIGTAWQAAREDSAALESLQTAA